MGDRHAEAAASLQDARHLSDRTVQIDDVLQGHERDRQIRRTSREREPACLAKEHRLAPRLVRHSCKGRRSIDSNDSMASLMQESAESALPTRYVQGEATRGRDELEEAGPVELPEEVVVFRRPSEPGP